MIGTAVRHVYSQYLELLIPITAATPQLKGLLIRYGRGTCAVLLLDVYFIHIMYVLIIPANMKVFRGISSLGRIGCPELCIVRVIWVCLSYGHLELDHVVRAKVMWELKLIMVNGKPM